jgi:hypothetical protein
MPSFTPPATRHTITRGSSTNFTTGLPRRRRGGFLALGRMRLMINALNRFNLNYRSLRFASHAYNRCKQVTIRAEASRLWVLGCGQREASMENGLSLEPGDHARL